jgi:hypothetical protein
VLCHSPFKIKKGEFGRLVLKKNINIWWPMPLFLILFILVSYSGVAMSALDIVYFCFGFVF